MSPEFSRAVDKVFVGVIDLLERISKNEYKDPSEERQYVRGRLDAAEAMLGSREDWQLAKYGLVAWIDEMMIEAPWPGSQWWENNALEPELFGDRNAYTLFYDKAKDASSMSNKDALEVFFVCVVLGFRGLYQQVEGMAVSEQYGLPATVEEWAKRTGMAIRLGQGKPPINESPREGAGAYPLDGRYQLIGMTFMAVALSAVAIILAWALIFNSQVK